MIFVMAEEEQDTPLLEASGRRRSDGFGAKTIGWFTGIMLLINNITGISRSV